MEDTRHQGRIVKGGALSKSFDQVLPALEDEDLEVEAEGVFTWAIDDWYSLTENKYTSPRVSIGEVEWNLLLFPQGNNNKNLAVYLEPHPEEEIDAETGKSRFVDPDWYCCAQFAVVLSRPGEDDKVYITNKSHHRFNSLDTDWGFANFIELQHLKYPTKGRVSGLISDGKLNISVYVRILKDNTGVLWHNFNNYDSKKVTGYVGFRNQGATCYLNSLLQSYFFTRYFRKLVYEIPTENESPNDSVPLALQRAFYQLQVSNSPLDTLELTKSFGWNTAEAFTQHDVQELNRILMDRLENRMKGTEVEGKLNEVFVGKMKSYIKCINVDYESSRVEDFWDIQLNVKNCKTLQDSFKNYVEVELMDGENQYAAQNFGLQDAHKGVLFQSFPVVLHLQLKRFEYDFNYDQLVKVNDRYEFPDSIDLSPYMDQSVLEDNGSQWVYKLHGVLVHTGDISTGHYYAMIKPGVEDQWYRFDDEKVWKVTKRQVFDENFGMDSLPDNELRNMTREEYQNYLISSHTSAYMLVYIRENKEVETLQPVSEQDVPPHVVASIQKEIRDYEANEKEIKEAHLYVKIRVHSLKNFINYQGFDLSPNPASNLFTEDLYPESANPTTLKLSRTIKLKDMQEQVVECLNLPSNLPIRFWKMGYRKNCTLRLEDLLATSMDDRSLEEALNSVSDDTIPPLDVFVEEPYLELRFLNKLKEQNKVDSLILSDDVVDDLRLQISKYIGDERENLLKEVKGNELIFIKGFDAEEQQLFGIGYVILSDMEDLSILSEIIAQNFATEADVEFVEELSPDQIEQVSEKQVYAAELKNGDILCFTLPSSNLPSTLPVYDNIEDFYKYLRYRVKLSFTEVKASDNGDVPIEASDAKKFDVWVSSMASYNELSQIVSQYSGTKPELLRMFAVYPSVRYALKSNSFIKEYLVRDYNCELVPPFEYQVLAMPLQELEHLRTIKLHWLKDSYIHYQTFQFKLSNSTTVAEFLDKIQEKVGFSDDDKKNVLIWTNHNFQFQSVLFNDNSLQEISKNCNLFARLLPEEVALVRQLDAEESLEGSELTGDTKEPTPQVKNSSGRLIIVMQYFKELDNHHGISFLFNLIPGENFLNTRKRLHERFGLGTKEFLKIKLSILVNTSRGNSLKSLQGLSEKDMEKVVLYNIMGHLDCIYMDHPDRLRSQNVHDRPMVIKN